jgi:hypothetical protein
MFNSFLAITKPSTVHSREHDIKMTLYGQFRNDQLEIEGRRNTTKKS